ncbi:uncharacterized protein DUF1993 [Rhizobium azibense]|uniref:Uncharacterized protein DUF1993 n=1 Tax=Rhizobium azibense TaxID=1136135 RepID=A0A4R3QR24_9HYPH|nr:uncharacterized protein DUF1993 [Rhizobium azibense]
MPISMYRLTVPMFQRGLTTLKNYLEKAEAYAREKGIDPDELVAARLAPDMLPLSGQYQRASDSAKLAVARLTATEAQIRGQRNDDRRTSRASRQDRGLSRDDRAGSARRHGNE